MKHNLASKLRTRISTEFAAIDDITRDDYKKVKENVSSQIPIDPISLVRLSIAMEPPMRDMTKLAVNILVIIGIVVSILTWR